MRDSPTFQDSFLFKLSKNDALGLFKTVILVGSFLDVYVPIHSALSNVFLTHSLPLLSNPILCSVEPCKASVNDPSALSTAYNEMLMNINESIVSSPNHTTLIKYSVAHALSNISQAQKVTGRANHIAVGESSI